MTSEKQLAANRRNAIKSTGPTSVAGKAASSMNAFKTGLHAKSTIVPAERPRDLQDLIAEYYSVYHPATPEARGLVDDLIRCEWTLRRLDTSEASLWNYQIADSFRPVPDEHRQGKIVIQAAKTFGLLQRRIDATRRGRDRALTQLRALAAQPLSMPAPAPLPEPEPARQPSPETPPETGLTLVTPHPPTASSQNGFVPSLFSDASSPAPAEPQNPSDSPSGPAHIPHI